jgi:chromosome condensin MukBEF MukE localization factor
VHNLTNYAILIVDGQEVLKWEPLGHYQVYKTKTTCGIRFPRSFFYTKTRATRSSIKEAILKESSLRIPFPNETICLIWSTDLQLQSELANKNGILSARVTITNNPETSYTNFIKFVDKILKGSEWYQINQKTTPPLS